MKSRLHLSKDKKLVGVCAGIAESFGFEVAIVRIIFVLLALLIRWPMVMLYIILWAILPSEI
ncbi:MAG: PspC domain-containing protein [Firmicutes bacterium]|nr:PspC domain-containing protein [Bacillota bacterium]